MIYLWANFITTIKDWSCVIINNKELNWVCLDKIDSFKFSPYLSDLVLYSIQSKKEGKESLLFPNLYENDLLNITEKSRNIIKGYFNLKWDYKSINFEEKDIYSYKNKHAYYHALWTHFASWYNNSVWLCIDYLGYNDFWNHQIQTIWNCNNKNVDLIDDFDTTLTLNRGIWFSYSIFADFFDIYKYDIPYLAVYWNKDRFKWIEIYEYKDSNVYLKKEFLEGVSLGSDLLPKTFYASIEELGSNLDCIYLNIKKIFNITDEEIEDAHNDLRKWIIADLLAYIQSETEKAILYLADKAYELWNSKNLTISGWLASDHLLSNALVNKSKFENFYFELSPNYTGISIWGAFDISNEKIHLEKTWYWKEYSTIEINKELEKYKDYLSFDLIDDILKQNLLISKELENKKIIWYFKWWTELWPRALWNRSILSIWDCEDLSDRIRNIKKRQNWKSFSVSVLEEEIWTYFDKNTISTFMSLSWLIKDKYKSIFAWVNFDNSTVRYQSVSKNNNIDFFKLLKTYKNRTWKWFLLNTSLNAFKQSIVETPKQSIELFLSTDIDILVLWNFIIKKDKVYSNFKFDYEKLKRNKNINYFEHNKKSYKNYLAIKKILEKIVLNWYSFIISEIKYFEREIDIEFCWNKISIEKLEIWKKYDLNTSCIWIKIKEITSKKDLIVFYKKLELVDSKIKSIFKNWDYYLKDLINYL